MNPRFFASICLQVTLYTIVLSLFMAGLVLTILINADPPRLDHPICREVCIRQCDFNAICEFNCYYDCFKEVDVILAYHP